MDYPKKPRFRKKINKHLCDIQKPQSVVVLDHLDPETFKKTEIPIEFTPKIIDLRGLN